MTETASTTPGLVIGGVLLVALVAGSGNAADARPIAVPVQSAVTCESDSAIVSIVASPGWELEASPEQLRSLLGSRQVSLEVKRCALRELVGRDDQVVPSFVAGALASRTMQRSWRDDLIHAADETRCADLQTRQELVTSLLQQAYALRDDPDPSADPPLWAALRTIGRYAQASEATVLLQFLRPQDRGKTRQVALQSLQTIFGRFADAHDVWHQEVIQRRLEELVAKYLDSDFLTTGANTALAANAFAATVLATPSVATALTDRVLELRNASLASLGALALADTKRGKTEPFRSIVARLRA